MSFTCSHISGNIGTDGEVYLDEQEKRLDSSVEITATIPEAPEATDLKHRWSESDSRTFQVRGLQYLKDRKKVPSSMPLMKARGADFIQTDKFGPSHIVKHFPSILAGRLRETPTLIFNIRMPFGNLAMYFEIPRRFLSLIKDFHDPFKSHSLEDLKQIIAGFTRPEDRAFCNFIIGENEYKEAHLKIIPKVIEGNILVRKLVHGKPVIIGEKLPVEYLYMAPDPPHGLAEYLEVDLDTGSSSLHAQNIISICKRFMTGVTVDIGWLIEGKSIDLLPECMLGAIRLHRIDPDKCPQIHVE